MARKSSRFRPNCSNRGDVVPQSRRRMALIERIDIVAPLLKRRQPLRPRTVGIGDVVDLPAKAVDLKHRLALLARQNPHRRVKRTAGRRRSVTRIWLPPPAASCAGRRFRHGPPPTARRASLAGDARRRCGRAIRSDQMHLSRSGDRAPSEVCTILSANAWITEISSPSRKSFTSAAERSAFIEQRFGPHGERMQALQQPAPTPRLAQLPRQKRRRPRAHRAEGRRG